MLALGRAQQGDAIAFGCLILLMAGAHCHSHFACRIWTVALVAAMLGDSSSAVRVATLCFALWKLVLPPKNDKAKLYEELALAKQNFGRAPCRSKDKSRRDEDILRQMIDKAKKTGGITEEQYRSLIPAAEDDDMGEAKSKLYEDLAMAVEDFLQVSFMSPLCLLCVSSVSPLPLLHRSKNVN